MDFPEHRGGVACEADPASGILCQEFYWNDWQRARSLGLFNSVGQGMTFLCLSRFKLSFCHSAISVPPDCQRGREVSVGFTPRGHVASVRISGEQCWEESGRFSLHHPLSSMLKMLFHLLMKGLRRTLFRASMGGSRNDKCSLLGWGQRCASHLGCQVLPEHSRRPAAQKDGKDSMIMSTFDLNLYFLQVPHPRASTQWMSINYGSLEMADLSEQGATCRSHSLQRFHRRWCSSDLTRL